MDADWIPIADYCRLSGDTLYLIHRRVAGGYWKRGVHYSCPDGTQGYVNTAAVAEWKIKSDAIKGKRLS